VVRHHLIPDLGRVRLSRLTPDEVQGMLNRKLEAGLSPRRVDYLRGILHRALNQALRWWAGMSPGWSARPSMSATGSTPWTQMR